MSILIKGIDMPRCESLTIKIRPSGAVCDQYGRLDERVKAVEVPKHGRLIDADVLTELVETEFRNWGEDYDASQFLGDMEDAPTIIEAERRSEES